MYKVCLIYMEEKEDACDVLQDSFVKIFKNLHTFRFEGSLRGWIRRTVVLTAINAYNKRKKEKELILPMSELGYEAVSATINDIIGNLEAKELIEKVNALPDKAKQVLKLHALEGFKHSEIAEILGITEGTSKSQLNRAKYLLQLSIQKSDE